MSRIAIIGLGGFLATSKWHSDETAHECAKQRFRSGTFAQSAIIAARPSLARAATIDLSFGNTVRSRPEFAAQSGLLIKDNEQMYGEGDPCHASKKKRWFC